MRTRQLDKPSAQYQIQQWSAMPASVVAAFGDEGDFARQHLLNPALFSLLGNVQGQQILDAGCGNGYLSRLLSRRGAQVTGLEPAAPLIEYALKREQDEPLGITYLPDDLTIWRDECRFDVVIANMVLMDIPDLDAALDTCFYHLRPRGQFIFSLSHPCFEASDSEYAVQGFITVQEYFRPYEIEQSWGNRFHRPLSHYFQAVIQRGGCIQAVVEPQLDTTLARLPIEKERNIHVPGFIIIQVKKE